VLYTFMRMSSNSGAPDNKIEFKMLDYSVVDNDNTV
jgi:hypothetical protein